jgi:hypothetical protein
VRPQIDRLELTREDRAAIERELPKMAGADLSRAPSLDRRQRDAVRGAIDEAFVSAFSRVMLGTALLAFAAAVIGSAIR